MSLVDNFGGSKVTVKKSQLLATMKKNRESHRGLFLKAQKGYRAAVIKELDRMLSEARNGLKIRRIVDLVEPEDHTSDYDRVIRMLEMSTATNIEISERQFSYYVLDEWGWSESFETSTRNYV